jgi:hypothetical protein
MFQTKVVEKIKTQILCSVTFFFENRTVFLDMCEKYRRAGQVTDGQYGACALHAGYLRLQIHTHRLCNTHCFYTTTMVARTRLIVTSYEQ